MLSHLPSVTIYYQTEDVGIKTIASEKLLIYISKYYHLVNNINFTKMIHYFTFLSKSITLRRTVYKWMDSRWWGGSYWRWQLWADLQHGNVGKLKFYIHIQSYWQEDAKYGTILKSCLSLKARLVVWLVCLDTIFEEENIRKRHWWDDALSHYIRLLCFSGQETHLKPYNVR